MSVFLFILSLLTGLGVYLYCMSRLISQVNDSYAKVFFAPLLLLLVVGGFGAFGWLARGTPWAYAPLGFLAWLLLNGVRLWLDRGKYRSTAPLSRSGLPLSWRRPWTTTELSQIHYRLCMESWKGKTLRIAFISDLHLTDKLPLDYYRSAFEAANAAEPGLLFLGGDFLTGKGDIRLLPELLELARSRFGAYAVLGNHDYWSGAQPIIEVLKGAGVGVLYNGWRRLSLDDGSSLLLAGCEAPWNKASLQAPPQQDGELCLAISHTGDNIYHLNQWGVDVVFSGHYHAGQWHLPGLGPLVVPSRFGRRFERGHFLVKGTHLFVSAGVGAGNPALRLYCQPDILIVDICSQEEM